jgi:hypothetical protein
MDAYIAHLLTAATGLLSLLGTFAYISSRLAKLELKVDTLWEFQMRRALSEALNKGVLAQNSPVRITDRARAWFSDALKTALGDFYREGGYRLGETELAQAIERAFGDRLAREICIPNNLDSGSCILAAIELAREASSSPDPRPPTPA